MSEISVKAEDETQSADLLTTEFRDGQLQIVEVTPFEMGDGEAREDEEADSDLKYMQVVDPSGKELMQLDLLNFTLVRCEDGEESYKLIANTELQEATEGSSNELADMEDVSTVTCVLQPSDGEEQEGEMSASYVMLQGENDNDSYVMVEGEQGPIVFLQSELSRTNNKKKSPVKSDKKKTPTTLELLEKAKAVNKAKRLLRSLEQGPRGRGRPRKRQFPETSEILSSPDFKLFLYNCRLCEFRCNATKELTKHKQEEHSNWKGNYRMLYGAGAGGRRGAQLLQCGRCPYRGLTQEELGIHIKKSHQGKVTTWSLATSDTEDAVLIENDGGAKAIKDQVYL